LVAFTIRRPSWSTPSILVEVDDPIKVLDVNRRSVVVEYQIPSIGTVLVREQQPTWTLDTMKRRAADKSAASGVYSIVDVRGTQGLLVTDNGTSRLVWIEGGVQFDILGPALSSGQVRQLASSL
jgi:hypothetical protein